MLGCESQVTSHTPLLTRIAIPLLTLHLIHVLHNAVLEELLRKLACCRYDFSAEESKKHLSSYQVSTCLCTTLGLPEWDQSHRLEQILIDRERLGNVGPEGITEYVKDRSCVRGKLI